MKIINLIEDTSGNNNCIAEHGLSFYVETDRHKLLVDTGATDAFLKNAELLGIDLNQVDTVILSHGHYDHSGGILPFAEKNLKARIYMQKSAGEDYCSIRETGVAYIGIDKKILELPQLEMVDGNAELDEELSLFTNITGREFWPAGNYRLKKRIDGELLQDEFAHEQCLVIKQDGKRYLLSGCAHNGIINILERFRELYGGEPDVVISGFHMILPEYEEDDIAMIQETARRLTRMKTKFYSGHCTGERAFAVMKEIMGEQLQAIHSGDKLEG
ncbi:MAG: MBL fold metallo-hydrolase [Lachnospiraceae bacterium]|nr:MBL fold metallo-hydrolase [Lachnospiraceae bacterium]